MDMHFLGEQPNVWNQRTENIACYNPKPSDKSPDCRRKELAFVGEDMSRQIASDQVGQD